MVEEDVAEEVFKEMDEVHKVPVEEIAVDENTEVVTNRKEMKRRLAELVGQKREMTAEIKKIKDNRSVVINEAKQLRQGLYHTKSPREAKAPRVELTPEQKQIKSAKSIMLRAVDSISHFRDTEDLKDQAYERAKGQMGRNASQIALEELKAEGKW